MSIRPEEADPAYLWDMRKAGRDALRITANCDQGRFLADETLQLAVERLLEILGEAARRVSPAYKAVHPEVAWRDLIGQRNVLAHDYGSINHQKLWEAVAEHLPGLLRQLDALIPPVPDDGGD